jgi:hypothetical protein
MQLVPELISQLPLLAGRDQLCCQSNNWLSDSDSDIENLVDPYVIINTSVDDDDDDDDV